MKSRQKENGNSLKLSDEQKEFLEKIHKSIEEDENLTDAEFEEKYKVLSNDWD